MRSLRLTIGMLVGLIVLATAAGAQVPDRRKDQFPKEFSYLVLPLPYSLPGIGSGFYLPLYVANVFDSYTDAYVLLITGDAAGAIYSVQDVHLIEKRLIASVFFQDLNKATYKNYTLRGMDTKQDDFQIVDLSSVKSLEGELRLTFWERRLEFWADQADASNGFTAVRDNKGNLIARFSRPLVRTQNLMSYGTTLDLTDDLQDPRRGLRVALNSGAVSRNSSIEPAYVRTNWAVTAYLPVGKISTLALHALRSDALVTSPGDVNPATVRQRVSLGCQAGDAQCQAAEDSQVNNAILHNRNGDSAGLGGDTLLRGYSDNRFQAAHTLYYAAEFRWNLTEEVTPFNYFIWKDVRTGVQIALFYEQGTVAETAGSLGDTWRSDWGVGVRMVTGSGAVFRADYAIGNEGGQTSIIVNYPF